MKKKILEKVLKFMKQVETNDMNSNQFVFEFLRWNDKDFFSFTTRFLGWPSVESILRARRKVIADYWIGKRTKADTEKEYIGEFARTNNLI